MKVITTPYSGSLSLIVRNHDASDYLLYIEDEEKRTFTTTPILVGATSYNSLGNLQIPLSVTLSEGQRYACILFRQDGTMLADNGTANEFWDEYPTLESAGTISSDVCRFLIFCTNQINKLKYNMAEGKYQIHSTPSQDEIISHG